MFFLLVLYNFDTVLNFILIMSFAVYNVCILGLINDVFIQMSY